MILACVLTSFFAFLSSWLSDKYLEFYMVGRFLTTACAHGSQESFTLHLSTDLRLKLWEMVSVLVFFNHPLKQFWGSYDKSEDTCSYI